MFRKINTCLFTLLKCYVFFLLTHENRRMPLFLKPSIIKQGRPSLLEATQIDLIRLVPMSGFREIGNEERDLVWTPNSSGLRTSSIWKFPVFRRVLVRASIREGRYQIYQEIRSGNFCKVNTRLLRTSSVWETSRLECSIRKSWFPSEARMFYPRMLQFWKFLQPLCSFPERATRCDLKSSSY